MPGFVDAWFSSATIGDQDGTTVYTVNATVQLGQHGVRPPLRGDGGELMAKTKAGGWIAGTIVLLLAMTAAAWFFVAQPRFSDASRHGRPGAGCAEPERPAGAKIAKLKADFAKLDDYRAQLADLRTQVPTAALLTDYTRAVQGVADASGVTLLDMSPGTAVAVVVPVAAVPAPAPTETSTDAPTDAPTDTSTCRHDRRGRDRHRCDGPGGWPRRGDGAIGARGHGRYPDVDPRSGDLRPGAHLPRYGPDGPAAASSS